MPPTLVDTDVLSALLRRDPVASGHARAYLAAHPRFSFSVISRYEILRGLQAKGATAQTAAFQTFCSVSEILPVTDAVATRAAELYAALSRRGALIGDADLLIAATALVHGMVVATNNQSHFGRISSLPLANWLV